MQRGCADINKKLYVYLIVPRTFDQPPHMAIVQCDRAAVSDDIMEKPAAGKARGRRGAFLLLHPASLSSSACVRSFRTAVIHFPQHLHPLPSPHYEYGKKCQDVFTEGVVDFRGDTDRFPEAHRRNDCVRARHRGRTPATTNTKAAAQVSLTDA